MKKITKITENDLIRIIKSTLLESEQPGPEMPETPPSDYDEVITSYKTKKGIEDNGDDEMVNQIAEHWQKRRINNFRLSENRFFRKNKFN